MIDSVFNTGGLRPPWKWTWGLVGVLLCALVLPASVQGQSAVESLMAEGRAAGADVERMRVVVSRAENAGLSSQQAATLLQPAVSLAKRDLPATPLLNKTLEGLAKQVPPARMTPVLQELRTHTEEAGTLISSWTKKKKTKALLDTEDNSLPRAERDQLIVSVAEARQQNVPVPNIETFLNKLPDAVGSRSVSANEVAVAVSVMPDLPAAASPPATSRALLTAALNADYDPESLRQLPGALERAQQVSDRPTVSIAKSATRAIQKGIPAPKMLRSLFQGTVPGTPPAVQNAPSSPPGQRNPPGRDGRPAPGSSPGSLPSDGGGQGPPPSGDQPSGDQPSGDQPGGDQPSGPPSNN